MYQQGRRIGEHLKSTSQTQFGEQTNQGEKYESYLAKQAQSYLAAIQAFSLIDNKNAWFTISTTHTVPLLHVCMIPSSTKPLPAVLTYRVWLERLKNAGKSLA